MPSNRELVGNDARSGGVAGSKASSHPLRHHKSLVPEKSRKKGASGDKEMRRKQGREEGREKREERERRARKERKERRQRQALAELRGSGVRKLHRDRMVKQRMERKVPVKTNHSLKNAEQIEMARRRRAREQREERERQARERMIIARENLDLTLQLYETVTRFQQNTLDRLSENAMTFLLKVRDDSTLVLYDDLPYLPYINFLDLLRKRIDDSPVRSPAALSGEKRRLDELLVPLLAFPGPPRCEVCNRRRGIYRCPACGARTCSARCSRQHEASHFH